VEQGSGDCGGFAARLKAFRATEMHRKITQFSLSPFSRGHRLRGSSTGPVLSTCFLEALPSKSTAAIVDKDHIVNNFSHDSHISGMDAETIKA
jgi:hypothetical protein